MELKTIAIECLHRGKFQPRKCFKENELNELAESIRAQGVIQPLVVRPLGNGSYEIIAGERRWRAAAIARLVEVPCVIRELDDSAAKQIALIENIQREELSPIEQAHALNNISNDEKMTHSEIAIVIGKERSVVTKLINLLKLSKDVQELVHQGELKTGHANTLLSLNVSQQRSVSLKAIDKKWSVRKLEAEVKRIKAKPANSKSKILMDDPDWRKYIGTQSEKACAPMNIIEKDGRFQLVVDFYNMDEIEGYFNRFN